MYFVFSSKFYTNIFSAVSCFSANYIWSSEQIRRHRVKWILKTANREEVEIHDDDEVDGKSGSRACKESQNEIQSNQSTRHVHVHEQSQHMLASFSYHIGNKKRRTENL